MTITIDLREIFNDLGEKYFEAVKLIKDDSKIDPVTDTLVSKNSAQQILIKMKETLNKLLKSHIPESPEWKKLIAMLGTVNIYLGTICLETEEFTMSEKYLQEALEMTTEWKNDPDFVSITMSAYNQLGILWFLKDSDKAKVYLETSMEFYQKNKNLFDPPMSLDSFFQVVDDKDDIEVLWEKFERIHTATLYYLAQVYGNLKNPLKSAVFCHKTLKRQLVYKKYEPIDWALNAATLAQFFAEQKGFKQARTHLSASSYVLDQYKKELDEKELQDEHYKAKLEEFNHRSADVARCWAQYGSILLSKSRERLVSEVEKDDPNYLSGSSDLAVLESSNQSVSTEDLNDLFFPSLDLSSYVNQVTDNFILTLADAKAVFLNVQSWLDKSQIYYALESLASDFIDITLSRVQLYQELSFFDENSENRAKYHKRGIDLLEDLLKKVNSQYYLSYCRKMWYEAGNIYLNLLDIKLDKQRESKDRPTSHFLSKINNIINKALNHFGDFINSFQNKRCGLTENYYKSYARAQFYTGVLHGKYITLDKQKKLDNTEASLSSYQKVIDFGNEHPSVKDLIAVEFGVCQEMVELLPVKIRKLNSELLQSKNTN